MDLEALDRQRQALEANLQKLRRSLKHWQTWEAEYEGLKEELLASDSGDLDAARLSDISKTYDGSLVDEKEVRDLTGLATDSPRRCRQIVGLIERRQEYVLKNIETISRQFFAAEGKLEEFAFASAAASGVDARFGDEQDPGDLPLTEIHEELDDDDNVVSSELRRPEEETTKIVESLRKAGLMQENSAKTDLTQDQVTNEGAAPEVSQDANPKSALATSTQQVGGESGAYEGTFGDEHGDTDISTRRPPIRKKSVSFSADTKPAPEPPRSDSQDGRKSVSFAPKVAVAPAADPPDTRSVSFSPKVEEIPAPPLGPSLPGVTRTAESDEQQRDLRASFKPGERVYELNEEDQPPAQHFVIPEDESLEDARMRRDMLDYHLNEVGNVVAQLDLDEGATDGSEHSDFTGSEHVDEADTPYTSGFSDDEAEDEDEYGRSSRGAMNDDYHEQMKALQARLIGNLGPRPQDDDLHDADSEILPEDVRRLVIRGSRSSSLSAISSGSEGDKKAANKKRVSFAESLDVADPGSPPLKAQKKVEGENVAPVSDSVVEKTTGPSNPTATTHKSLVLPDVLRDSDVQRSQSPYTQEGAGSDDVTTEAPSLGAPLAEMVVERPLASSSAPAPSADGEDPLLARRELAAEYYRRRNDIIKQQGGFRSTEDEDDEHGELMEERDGRIKKVSRFKAARING